MECTPYKVHGCKTVCKNGCIMGIILVEERKKETLKRGLRDRLNPTLVPAIRVPGPREQTYTARGPPV